MKPFTSFSISLLSTLGMCVAILLASQGRVQAQPTLKTPSGQIQPRSNIQVNEPPKLKLCPDLKVSFTLIKGSNGLVTMQGTVTNVGKGDYDIMSKAEVIMNLSYAPQFSYAMTGVSDVRISTPFTKLRAGASFPVNGTYQIPDFNGWVSGSIQANAKRLFTLRVVKQDMSTYKPGEDCNPGDNSKSVELAYRELKH
ncbi:MAG: hypothetical protein EHM79_15185 [Geobacter sp.]|nr:MAG: hypothetical protein EHM79_15185 [Geobacter sp.]